MHWAIADMKQRGEVVQATEGRILLKTEDAYKRFKQMTNGINGAWWLVNASNLGYLVGYVAYDGSSKTELAREIEDGFCG